MLFATREDAEITARIFAKFFLRFPEEYRRIAVGGFFLLQFLGIYYLHTTLHK